MAVSGTKERRNEESALLTHNEQAIRIQTICVPLQTICVPLKLVQSCLHLNKISE